MGISSAEHILATDDSALAVCLMDHNFHVLEVASKPPFTKKFKISDKLRKDCGDYAAVIFGTAQIPVTAFGKFRRITVDYDSAKTMLIQIGSVGFVGLVLQTSANADLLALKIEDLLGTDPEDEDYR